jgi:hypothetical protein
MRQTVERDIPWLYAVAKTLPLDEAPDGDTERFVLKCDCRAKLVLGSFVVAWLIWHDEFECGFCGKGFTITEMVSERYSWMEDYSERIEGKEARNEYYTRLERQASTRA